VLALVVDETGHVAEVEVVTPQDPELDRRAVDAARRFEFEPARRGDAPLRVKIQYAYVFEAAPPPPPAEIEPAPAPPALEAKPAPALPPPPVPADQLDEFEGTATVDAPPREVTRRTIATEEIRRMPGTRGDVLRSIEVMPGVARTSLDSGDPILRGAGFNESLTVLNGTPVPFLYHFGGLTSFLSSRMVSKLDLYPGNFSVRYGRVAGGVIEVQARDPDSERLRLALDLSLIDSAAFVEVPIGDRTGVAAAVRRSNIDFVFENLVPKDAYSVVAAPVYYDYQLFAVHRFSRDTRLRLLAYGSRDTLKLLFSDPNDEDPGLTGDLEGKLEFHRVGLELEGKPFGGLTSKVSATVGRVNILQRIGALEQDFDGNELISRGELAAELLPSLRLMVGADFVGVFAAGRFRGPLPGSFEGDPREGDALGSQRTISDVDNSINGIRGAGYLELGYNPVSELLITPGVRVDYFDEFSAWTVDPRLSARYELTPSTAVKAGVGKFTQSPEFWQVLPSVGNPNLKPYYALQTSAGFEQKIGEGGKVGVEGFYKRMEDYVVGTPEREEPHYLNTGGGRIYGGEVSGELRTRSKGSYYLAYTLSRSERRQNDESDYRLFDRDQTHVLSLVGSQGLGKGWEVGARFRYVSGNPTTPITGSVYDARTGVYIPTYGAVNSDRNPAFHQLDLRVEKSWKAGPVTLAAYLELQNAYNSKNQEGYRYSYDYSKRESVSGLPLFPNLGLRGEL
jgi:TonB family protein